MNEWELRALAAALRPELPGLLGKAAAAELDKLIAQALDLTPGRAKGVLRDLLLLDAAAPVREWVQARLPLEPDIFRIADLPVQSAPPLADADRGDLGARLQGGWSEVDAQVLSFRIRERERDPGLPLTEGQSYTAVFMAGEDVPGNLFAGQDTAELTNLPPGRLATRWVVVSRMARLAALDPGVAASRVPADDRLRWVATFSLDIPSRGNSALRSLALTPLAAPEARVDVLIYVGNDLYRQLTVSLDVKPANPGAGRPATGGSGRGQTATVITDRILPAAHAGLGPVREWQRPAHQLDVYVTGDDAVLIMPEEGLADNRPWRARQSAVETSVVAVRDALSELRDSHFSYFNEIDPDTLLPTLDSYQPPLHWDFGQESLFARDWPAVVHSPELHRLAQEGNELYHHVFEDDYTRELIGTRLQPGDMLKLTWRNDSAGWVPYLPLPLMYIDPPPDPDLGRPVDPTQFLGLRFRLGYVARRTSSPPRALGDWSRTTRAHLLYWGAGPGDQVADESLRHRTELSTWQPALLLPESGQLNTGTLASYLRAPGPAPVSLLYFYCHYRDGDGTNPLLRFGPTMGKDSVLRRSDIGSSRLADAPVVFVNACGTNVAEPLLANRLMELFFIRNCRAYIGTETEVPAPLAARFATTFFSFLYGAAGRGIAPVGEAIAQARRFLWTEYQNIGGLFYNYVNDYALYAADDQTVAGLRRHDDSDER